jgi:hypothetical protein
VEPQDVAEMKADVFCSLGEPATLALRPEDGFFVQRRDARRPSRR